MLVYVRNGAQKAKTELNNLRISDEYFPFRSYPQGREAVVEVHNYMYSSIEEKSNNL